MNKRISKIPNDVQDRNSVAWKKLCEYIDEVAEKGADEFVPREALGNELFSEIFTLPESISKLKKVTKIGLYGSNLKRIPPEIGEMESLEYFDPYTSYDLNWFPYEITKCKKLKDSRISTRALYGNYKNRMGFPKLDHNPVRYFGENLKCSVCDKELDYGQTNQMWITAHVGTDTVPMLANLCSEQCRENLKKPPKDYVQFPHKGGADLVQPLDEDELWEIEMAERENAEKENEFEPTEEIKTQSENKKLNISKLPILKLVRKIWEK
ncbi:leucine-rich repeat domain-containing protein [Winogradskyella sp. F6397]|uniref:Leucine-rich repeat domain-containing protein n=1 Tax=Winogradskyella marina TaxID=2785530 RepID=A0ABS0EME1_9FLAO|nr:leucine-rich repeat domain-containing protein [Winogradskyella marina]MBF8151603.1 leucine-rich repeat domain-containing protein [Winogradskyella marina]